MHKDFHIITTSYWCTYLATYETVSRALFNMFDLLLQVLIHWNHLIDITSRSPGIRNDSMPGLLIPFLHSNPTFLASKFDLEMLAPEMEQQCRIHDPRAGATLPSTQNSTS